MEYTSQDCIDSGKCFGLGTKIRLASGAKKLVEELTMNDSVLGLDGQPKKIIEIHQGEGKLYRVYQKFGKTYTINGNHILVLKFFNTEDICWDTNLQCFHLKYLQNMVVCHHRFSYCRLGQTKKSLYQEACSFLLEKSKEPGYHHNGDTYEISVKNYLSLPTDLKQFLFGFKQSVEFMEQAVEINPYLLGVWLGGKNIMGGPFQHALARYNLLNNKRIPNEYLYNSRNIRLKLLAGLVDTCNGYIASDGLGIGYQSKTLSKNIRDLCTSLGFKVSYRKIILPDPQLLSDAARTFIHISGNGLEEIPVIIPKNKPNPSKQIDHLFFQIVVTEYSYGKYIGFQIEDYNKSDCASNGKFFGTDFTVLHW